MSESIYTSETMLELSDVSCADYTRNMCDVGVRREEQAQQQLGRYILIFYYVAVS